MKVITKITRKAKRIFAGKSAHQNQASTFRASKHIHGSGGPDIETVGSRPSKWRG